MTNDIQHHTTSYNHVYNHVYNSHLKNIVKYLHGVPWAPGAQLSMHNAQVEKSTEEPPRSQLAGTDAAGLGADPK